MAVSSMLHMLPVGLIRGESVTEESKWHDDYWHFENPTPGQKRSTSLVTWKFQLPDGTWLTDPVNTRLLEYFKRLLYGLRYAPCGGRAPISPGTVSMFSSGMRDVVRWMVWTNRQDLKSLGPDDAEEFVHDLPDILSNSCWPCPDESLLPENAGSRANRANSRLKIFEYMWHQREALEKAGFPLMSGRPFYGSPTYQIARELATEDDGRIEPLPDEVSISLFNSASRLLSEPAEDVVQLLHGTFRESRMCDRDPHRNIGKRRQREFVESFKFKTIAGEQEPWHPPISHCETAKYDRLRRFDVVRRLSSRIRAACHVVIQGMSGMRISEICALEAGYREDGIPQCVKIRSTPNGIYEAFFLTSRLSKTAHGGASAEWLVGLRPKGASDLPLPVRAVQVLNQLYAPWRELSPSTRALFISFANPYGLPNSASSVRPADSYALNRELKRFVQREVACQEALKRGTIAKDPLLKNWKNSNGGCISTHQLRKSFAQFLFDCDRRLLPAIQQQFKHVSIAMTETGYVSNSTQKADLETARAQQTGLLLLEALQGVEFAGKRWGRMKQSLSEFRRKHSALAPSQQLNILMARPEIKAITMFFDTYGACVPTRPNEMRCRKISGETSMKNHTPDFSIRSPSVCAGCECFLVARRHSEFWISRYIEHWRAYRSSIGKKLVDEYSVIKKRALQSRAILRKLGVDTDEIDKRLERENEEE